MPLVSTEEQTMLRDSARDYLGGRSPITALRQLRDERDERGYATDLWAGFAEMGFTGLLVPEAHGGLGLGMAEVGVVMEEIGRQLTASPFFASSVVAVTALRAAGSDAQQREWLPRLASGELVATLAVDEASKHRPSAIALSARRDGDSFVLDGHKTFVVDGHVADVLIVAATVGGDAGPTLFIVDAGTPGVSVERSGMLDAHNAARIAFAAVRVHATAVLGEVGAGGAHLEASLDAGRAAAAAELLGVAEASFARTVAYLKERTQFGRVIGEFQALQHRAARLYGEIELSRAAVMKALQALDDGADGAALAVAVAKAHVGNTATLAVQEGVQMHGGMGMTDEFDMGLFMKRARVLQELFGDANFHTDRVAQLKSY